MTAVPVFTPEVVKAVLSDVLTALNSPENIQKLAEAKENSGNEMLKMMQFVFPLFVQIQMNVIKNYGFPEGREGAVQFAQLLRTLEREDPEISQLHNQTTVLLIFLFFDWNLQQRSPRSYERNGFAVVVFAAHGSCRI